MKVVFSCLMLAAATVPSAVNAQGLPSGMIFFYTSGAVCPSGSSRVDDASGRLLLGTAQMTGIAKVNSADPMTNQKPSVHTHAATFTFDVKSNSIKSQTGKRDTGTDGEKTSTLVTDPSNGNLPYSQYLVCEVN